MNELVTYQDKTLTTYDEVERAAKAMAASGFFADTKQASQAVVKILAARELGLGPFAGMNGVNIIQGKPAFSANIMAACVKKSGRYNYRVTEMTDAVCTIEFMEKIDGKWMSSGVSKFTTDDARKAGTKNLEKFPRNMLFARAMSNGVRWYCPDVMSGSVVYTPEELGADVDQDGNVINIEPNIEPVEEIKRVETEPEPKEPTHKWERPMEPETLREALQIKIEKAKPATDNQRKTVKLLLINLFGEKSELRYRTTEYLTGVRHTDDITPKVAAALYDWMKPRPTADGTGEFVMDKMAQMELQSVANLVENSDQDYDLDA